MHQQRPHFGDGHLRFFFPPTAVVAAPGTTTPRATGPCGGANLPSPASRTRPDHTPPWPLGNFARPTSDRHAHKPASPAAPLQAHWSGGISPPPAGPTTAAPTNAPAPR